MLRGLFPSDANATSQRSGWIHPPPSALSPPASSTPSPGGLSFHTSPASPGSDDRTEAAFKYISPTAQDILFRGIDGIECEEFIFAVRKWAWTSGNHQDDRWIADFAVTCFMGDALRWLLSLPDETQESWKALQKALIARYPAPEDRMSSTMSFVPTPAAAAPILLNAHRNLNTVAAGPPPQPTLPRPFASDYRGAVRLSASGNLTF